MSKPASYDLYDAEITNHCERVLVTLLRRFGPWKDSIYLIGGLVPRYLVTAKPPEIPEHAGTGDVDIVVDLAVLADTTAYKTLAQNLKDIGFIRAKNADGKTVNWQWEIQISDRLTIVLDLLADDPERGGGKIQELPTEGNISAVNIPHASIVFDLHTRRNVTADLLSDNGQATETIRHANIVSFTCLKALAFDQRGEPKDAHDLLYCIEYAEGSVAQFVEALQGPHRPVIEKACAILRDRFCGPNPEEGYRRDGNVSVAKFEIGGDDNDLDLRERRALRQRASNQVITKFLADLGL